MNRDPLICESLSLWFDFGSKANQSESRIKLVRALPELWRRYLYYHQLYRHRLLWWLKLKYIIKTKSLLILNKPFISIILLTICRAGAIFLSSCSLWERKKILKISWPRLFNIWQNYLHNIQVLLKYGHNSNNLENFRTSF